MALCSPLHDPAQGAAYERHRPEETVLYRTVERQWPGFVERAEEVGGLPKFVVREVDEYLRCGRLEHGCLSLRCGACGFERLVAFSCKRRGFCPSCLGRRMADTAVHLVEKVIPEVPVRQWVCSLPWRLRVLCGYDRSLCTEVLDAFMVELSHSLRHRAKRELHLRSVKDALTGAVSVIQRGDSALRLNVHFHVLTLDGVYVRDAEGGLSFHALREPTAAEVTEVAARTAARAQKILARHGRTLEGTGERDAEQDPEQLALATCYGLASSGLTLDEGRSGQPLLRIVDPKQAREQEPAATVLGFNVHAKVCVPARDRARLERLCRYLCRPPIAQERLEELSSGNLRYALKKPWKDGTVAIVLTPDDLLARICALVPPPRLHMVRYHGVLSSHASLRPLVVPKPDVDARPTRVVQLELFGDVDEPSNDEPRRKPWAWLLRHVFEIDVTTCPHCSGPMSWIEAATTPAAIARVLAKHGLGPRPPPPPAPPGQLRLTFPKP